MASTLTTSQPIALPIVHANPNAAGSYVDFQMADGSYTGSSGPFNPASYTRHFLGSPISWRVSSFNAGSFPQRVAEPSFQGSIDANEMRYGRTPSSIAEDRDSLLNALNLFDREGDLCRNYTCCGLHLNDLHELLEHFEAVHIVLVNGDVQNPQMQIPFNPIANPVSVPAPPESPVAFDPDDMELELDLDNTTACLAPPIAASHSSPSSGAPTPPDTPISTPLSAWPSPNAFRSHHITPASSQPPSPRSKTAAPTRTSSPVPASAFRPNLSLNLGGASAFSRAHVPSPHLTKPEDAFNSYARFSQDYSSGLPGAQFNAAPADEASMVANPPNASWQQNGGQQQPGCVPPALLFSTSVSATPASTPGCSRVPSPSGYAQAIAQAHTQQAVQAQGSTSMPTTPISSTPVSRPPSLSRTSSTASPSLLLSKPFKCPKPNCNKSYKQANGLKYHMTHGSCNFAPPKDLEHVKDLLERKKRERERERERDLSLGRVSSSTLNTPTTSGPATPTTELAAEYGITEMDLREVEREAERRLRPFACGVGDCQRRYKNMNGLRYHYQHSGEHGAQGLALLASGQHECLQGAKRGHHSNHNSQQQQQVQQPLNQYTTVEDREGKKRLVIRPMVHQPQSQAQQVQVQEQRNGINASTGSSVTVPVTVCDQQQSQQHSPVPQQNTTQIHVTPVVVSPSASQQGQQQQQSAAVYAGQYSPSQQPNPYAYACYTPPTASNSTNNSSSPGPSTTNSPVRQASSQVRSPAVTNAYQQQTGYFSNISAAGYLGMSGMNLGLGLAHSGMNSLMGMQNGGYPQPTQAQIAAFHQQLKDQYREYAAQVQQQQQQAQGAKEGATI